MANNEIPVLYINFTVQNGTEAVKHHITKRLEKSLLPQSIAEGAAQAAGDLASPKIVAKSLSKRLCRCLPKEMLKRGLTVNMKEVFREGSYFVLKLQVIRLDTSVITGLDDNWLLWWFLGDQQSFEEMHMPKVVCQWLALTMTSYLQVAITKEKMEAETKIFSKANPQARYFSWKIQQMRKQGEGGEKSTKCFRSRIRQFRKRFSSDEVCGGRIAPNVDRETTISQQSSSFHFKQRSLQKARFISNPN